MHSVGVKASFYRCCPHSLTFGYFKFSQNNILISLTLYFHFNTKDWKCRAVEKKGGKEKRKSLCYKIGSESTETVRFVRKRFSRRIMTSFWFGAKESDSRYDSLCLSIRQSSPEHSRLNAFKTPQLTHRTTCRRTQQLTVLGLFAWDKKFDWFQTLLPTTRNRVCRRTHVTSNSSKLTHQDGRREKTANHRITKPILLISVEYKRHFSHP